MPRKPSKQAKKKAEIVAFKVEKELAEFLDHLPNKSDFIRRAILAQFNMTCPLCTGTGVVARGLHLHFNDVIARSLERPCAKCETPQGFPLSSEAFTEEDRPRLEQFFRGGPLYCAECYETIPPCDDCGWHIPLESIAEHHRQSHLT